jgi:hypothetical protein
MPDIATDGDPWGLTALCASEYNVGRNGVIAGIAPFNAPFLLAVKQVVSANASRRASMWTSSPRLTSATPANGSRMVSQRDGNIRS